jgi:hypothetical protein
VTECVPNEGSESAEPLWSLRSLAYASGFQRGPPVCAVGRKVRAIRNIMAHVVFYVRSVGVRAGWARIFGNSEKRQCGGLSCRALGSSKFSAPGGYARVMHTCIECLAATCHKSPRTNALAAKTAARKFFSGLFRMVCCAAKWMQTGERSKVWAPRLSPLPRGGISGSRAAI